MKLTQVVPRLPPPPEGIGSYALSLAGALASHCAVESRFVLPVATARAADFGELPAATIEPHAAELEEALSDCDAPVLVHYANYGYERRGCPRWLLEGLTRWLAAGRDRRLVTFFHEVYASGPPWRSSFWLRPEQRRIAASMARASAVTSTSLELYAEMLRPWVERTPAVLPVFSTIGEPGEVPAWEERPARLVVFGGRGARDAAFGPLAPELELACRRLGIEEVCDVGPPLASLPDRLGPATVVRHGVLPAPEVSALLLAARAGYLAYPAHFLAKSTIFAAYAAHGVLAVRGWPRRERLQAGLLGGELAPGAHYWEPAGGLLAGLGAIAAAARAWYARHRLEAQAKAFRDWLFP